MNSSSMPTPQDHDRQERRRRSALLDFNSTLWMAAGWVLLALALVFPFPWWW